MTGCPVLASALVSWDWAAIGLYFAIIMGVTWWVILRNKDTADDYFLAGRNLGWFVVGASIFASNMARNISSAWRVPAAQMALRWPITNCMRGVCWFWRG